LLEQAERDAVDGIFDVLKLKAKCLKELTEMVGSSMCIIQCLIMSNMPYMAHILTPGGDTMPFTQLRTFYNRQRGGGIPGGQVQP
jgi:hypothetical protein